MDGKAKHLEFIQAIVTRMANNSFAIKGWSIFLFSAFLAFVASRETGEPNPLVLMGAVFPLSMLWFLDGYFLHQERLFRDLYNEEAQSDGATTFALRPPPATYGGYFGAVFSHTVAAFHGPFFGLACVMFVAGGVMLGDRVGWFELSDGARALLDAGFGLEPTDGPVDGG